MSATIPHLGGNQIAQSDRAESSDMQLSVQSSGPGSAQRGRVLVVEDDPEAALFAAYALEKSGFAVTCTADPLAALALATTEHWDLAVTDLDLPVISGLKLIAALREIRPGLPVILVTAHPRDEVGALPAGGPDCMLVKPLSAAHLASVAVSLAGRAAR